MRLDEFHTSKPYGDAGFLQDADAGPLTKAGRPAGVLSGGQIVRFHHENSIITFGGAGSAKWTRMGQQQTTSDAVASMFALDTGEISSVCQHYQVMLGREFMAYNPHSIGLNVQGSSCNPMEGILKADEHLFSKALLFADMLSISPRGDSDNAWVGQGELRLFMAGLCFLTLRDGVPTVPNLWRLLDICSTDDDAWKAIIREVNGWPCGIHAAFTELYQRKKLAQKEFGAIMGAARSSLIYCGDALVSKSLDSNEMDLSKVANPKARVCYKMMLSPQMRHAWSGLARFIVGGAMLHCAESSGESRPLFFLDEAAILGGASFLKSAVSQFRKKFQTHLVYQSIAQMEEAFGAAGAKEIMDSCDTQWMGGGIREIETASTLSRMLGQATIKMNNPVQQADRAHRARSLIRDIFWNGGSDPFEMMREARHEAAQAHQQETIGRALLDEAELLRLPADKQILLFPSLGLRPILCNKLPAYFTDPNQAGTYGPSPHFPPFDSVPISLGRRSTHRRFLRVRCPSHLAHFPQHRDGYIRYVEGFRTW